MNHQASLKKQFALDLPLNESSVKKVKQLLQSQGIKHTDRRVKDLFEILKSNAPADQATINKVFGNARSLIEKSLHNKLIIPDFSEFSNEIKSIYHHCQTLKEGEVAGYIPQLARVNPANFGVSITTIDGQQLSLGDTDKFFALQSVSKTINYALALDEWGVDTIHDYVGREPSGQAFNSLTLNEKNRPHNPMINAGAIMCCSLIRSFDAMADRLAYVMNTWKHLSGGHCPHYNEQMYWSEKQTAYRNYAIYYFMKEFDIFPKHVSKSDIMEFYFKICSLELNCIGLSKVASALANAGVCPFTNERIFPGSVVQNVLSMMSTCGMYDFSGEFFFQVGLPTKSGVSGAMMIVVPNVMGIAVWSPPLDDFGNSVKGVEFCRELVKTFNFHIFDAVNRYNDKKDPRNPQKDIHVEKAALICSAAMFNDVNEIKRLLALGVNINAKNCDYRSALHLAAAEGSKEALEFLLDHGADINIKDRWYQTPLAIAKALGYDDIVALLQARQND